MELTIHSVERLQQRTALSLQELRLMFRSGAALPLGDVAGASYSLLYDPKKNRCVISCVRDGSLVTILRIQYKVPIEIRSKITLEARNAAKFRYHTFARKKSGYETDAITITLSIYEQKSVSIPICSEKIMTVTDEGVAEVSKADLLRICLTECDRLLTFHNKVKPLPLDLRVELTLRNVAHKLVRKDRYTLAAVIAARDVDTAGAYCTLIVRDVDTSYEHVLGSLAFENARSDGALLGYFANDVAKIVGILSGALPARRLRNLRYTLSVSDFTTGILIRKVHRKHHELDVTQSNWASS